MRDEPKLSALLADAERKLHESLLSLQEASSFLEPGLGELAVDAPHRDLWHAVDCTAQSVRLKVARLFFELLGARVTAQQLEGHQPLELVRTWACTKPGCKEEFPTDAARLGHELTAHPARHEDWCALVLKLGGDRAKCDCREGRSLESLTRAADLARENARKNAEQRFYPPSLDRVPCGCGHIEEFHGPAGACEASGCTCPTFRKQEGPEVRHG